MILIRLSENVCIMLRNILEHIKPKFTIFVYGKIAIWYLTNSYLKIFELNQYQGFQSLQILKTAKAHVLGSYGLPRHATKLKFGYVLCHDPYFGFC